jgi:hypothetical protein
LDRALVLLIVGVARGPEGVAVAVGLAAMLPVGLLVVVIVDIDLVEVLVFVAIRVVFL